MNNPTKWKAVREFVATVRVNLVCFQETKLDIMDQFTIMQCPGPSFDGFAYLLVDGTRGEVLIAWKSSVLEMDAIQFDANFVTGQLHTKVGEPWCMGHKDMNSSANSWNI